MSWPSRATSALKPGTASMASAAPGVLARRAVFPASASRATILVGDVAEPIPDGETLEALGGPEDSLDVKNRGSRRPRYAGDSDSPRRNPR